jgi:hypothetical protein
MHVSSDSLQPVTLDRYIASLRTSKLIEDICLLMCTQLFEQTLLFGLSLSFLLRYVHRHPQQCFPKQTLYGQVLRGSLHIILVAHQTCQNKWFGMQSGLALGVFAWLFSWLCTFKVIGLLLGTTSLAFQTNWVHFLLCFALPLVPVPPDRDPSMWINRMAIFAGTMLMAGAMNLTVWTPLLMHITKGSWQPATPLSIVIHCVLRPDLFTLLHLACTFCLISIQ